MMSKTKFLEIFRKQLKGLPEKEINEIIYDYEEHFNIGMNEGRSEEEIASSLGNPRLLAKEMKANYMINRAEDSYSIYNFFNAMLATLALGFLNLVFILGPFIAIVSVIIALFASGITIIGSGLFVLVVYFLPEYFHNIPHLSTGIFTSIALISFGCLWIIATVYLTKLFYNLTIKYLKFNVNIIKNRREKND